MTAPDQPPAEQRPAPAEPSTGPTVTTAPPRSRWRFSGIPAHVGPARTSTIVLALLFVGIFVLYLYVKPPSPTTTGTTSGTTGFGTGQVSQPTPSRTPSATPTRTPTTAPASSTTSDAPSSSGTATRSRTATATPTPTTGAATGTSSSTASLPSLPTSSAAPSS